MCKSAVDMCDFSCIETVSSIMLFAVDFLFNNGQGFPFL